MHTLPPFYPTHACPPPILSHPMHALPLFYPSSCTPFPYSIPPHTCPLFILVHPTHALPVFYPNPMCVLSCSQPAHIMCHPSTLFFAFQLMHALQTPCHIYWKASEKAILFLFQSGHAEYHHHLPILVI